MKAFLVILSFFSLLACHSKPVRPLNTELQCMEKTTRKSCTKQKDGKTTCTCVPDDSEMYGTYPH